MKEIEKFQNKATYKIVKSLNENKKSLVHQFCGTGKTRLAVKVINKFLKKKSNFTCLWLTHRKELLTNSKEELECFLNKEIGVYTSYAKQKNCQLVIASIPCIARKENLHNFPRNWDLIVFDEVHHIPAPSWKRLYSAFPKSKKLGMSATIFRPDDKSVIDFLGNPSISLDFNEAKENNMILDIEGWLVLTNSVIEGISGKYDYKPSQVDVLVESKQRNKIIVNSYKKYGRRSMDKQNVKYKTICFCINIDHAKRMERLFNRNGVSAKTLTHKTEKYYRNNIINKFNNSDEIEVLCVVDILNEGVDIPSACCAILTKPTRSQIKYVQRIGRVVRKEGNKKKAIVLDYRDAVSSRFYSYNFCKLYGYSPQRKDIVTEYLDVDDPVEKERKIEDVMENALKFEKDRYRKTIVNRELNEEQKKFIKYNFSFFNPYVGNRISKKQEKVTYGDVERIIKIGNYYVPKEYKEKTKKINHIPENLRFFEECLNFEDRDFLRKYIKLNNFCKLNTISVEKEEGDLIEKYLPIFHKSFISHFSGIKVSKIHRTIEERNISDMKEQKKQVYYYESIYCSKRAIFNLFDLLYTGRLKDKDIEERLHSYIKSEKEYKKKRDFVKNIISHFHEFRKDIKKMKNKMERKKINSKGKNLNVLIVRSNKELDKLYLSEEFYFPWVNFFKEVIYPEGKISSTEINKLITQNKIDLVVFPEEMKIPVSKVKSFYMKIKNNKRERIKLIDKMEYIKSKKQRRRK